MPVYQSFADEYNRVLFRQAMAQHKKGKFIWRKSKGETSGVLILALRERFGAICELVIEGHFAQQGLIDRDLLLQRLNEFRHGKIDQLWPLMNLMVTEIWLRSWEL